MLTNLYLFELECRAKSCLTEILEFGSWSNIHLVVSDLPGEAVLIQKKEFLIKGGSTVMACSVEERGSPEFCGKSKKPLNLT